MGFAERFEAGPPIRKSKCAIAELYDELKEKKKQADIQGLTNLIDAVRKARQSGVNSKQAWNARSLIAVITAEGYKVSRRQLDAHINQECSCDK